MKPSEDKYGIPKKSEIDDHKKPFEDQCGHPDLGDLEQVGGSEDAERCIDSRVMRNK